MKQEKLKEGEVNSSDGVTKVLDQLIGNMKVGNESIVKSMTVALVNEATELPPFNFI